MSLAEARPMVMVFFALSDFRLFTAITFD